MPDDLRVRLDRDYPFVDQPLHLLFDEVAAPAARFERRGHVDRADGLLRTCARCRVGFDEEPFHNAELGGEAIAILSQACSFFDDARHGVGREAQETVRSDAPRDEGGVCLDCRRRPVHECGELGLHLEQSREIFVTVAKKRVQPGIADEHDAYAQRDRLGFERGDGKCGVLVGRILDRQRALAQGTLYGAVRRSVCE